MGRYARFPRWCISRNELRVLCAHLSSKIAQSRARCQIGSNERGGKESDCGSRSNSTVRRELSAKNSVCKETIELSVSRRTLPSAVISCLFRSGQQASICRSFRFYHPMNMVSRPCRCCCVPLELNGICVLPFTPCLCVTATPVLLWLLVEAPQSNIKDRPRSFKDRRSFGKL